ncbi:hypothetical protein XENOCAPTIV_004770 [Xenoophorus captivus]|uniref:Uncharacterized protein n=1 Tax=Xenoophorus captivus TaxID=1517983 RepID=A0ABV0S584_9TELE
MIECGLFSEALESIRSALFPGLLPPATYLISLLEYAQQVMENLLITNPPWLAPSAVKKYYAQVLQCPQCKMGLWPLLETAVREFVFPQQARAPPASASSSLLYGTFWTVWERTTLLSRTVKKLLQLLTEAAIMSPSVTSYKTGKTSHSCRSQGTSRSVFQSLFKSAGLHSAFF